MLNSYIAAVQRLLHNQSGTLYSTSDLTIYINDARKQVAQEGQCVRAIQNFILGSGVQTYTLGSLTFAPASGIQTAIETRSVLANGSWCQPRNWEWFTLYCLASPNTAAIPTTWSQFGDGISATVYVWPTPTLNVSVVTDVACYPIDLVDDSTVEAIPYPWQRAVKYYASYLAFLGVMRNADADNMQRLYAATMQSARFMTRATVLPAQANSDWSTLDRASNAPQ